MVPDSHSPISLSTVHAQAPPERLLSGPGQKCPGNGAKQDNNMDACLTVFGAANCPYLVYKYR